MDWHSIHFAPFGPFWYTYLKVREKKKKEGQKCKTDPLTFSLFHFNSLTFSFVILVL